MSTFYAKTDFPKSKIGGSKLSRSETVTVRLDARLRYMAELAARKQRRTLSSFIEWAIEETLKKQVLIRDNFDPEDSSKYVWEEVFKLWDVDDADRFAKLALNYPELLTHEEQVLWKLIKENGSLWLGNTNKQGIWTWTTWESSLIYERLREHWEVFQKVAKGEAEQKDLPPWKKEISLDDDIPF